MRAVLHPAVRRQWRLEVGRGCCQDVSLWPASGNDSGNGPRAHEAGFDTPRECNRHRRVPAENAAGVAGRERHNGGAPFVRCRLGLAAETAQILEDIRGML